MSGPNQVNSNVSTYYLDQYKQHDCNVTFQPSAATGTLTIKYHKQGKMVIMEWSIASTATADALQTILTSAALQIPDGYLPAGDIDALASTSVGGAAFNTYKIKLNRSTGIIQIYPMGSAGVFAANTTFLPGSVVYFTA